MLRTTAGIVLAFFPERYRSRFEWAYVSTAGAIISAVLQLVVCLIAFIYRYIVFAGTHLPGGSVTAMMAGAEKGGETAIMGAGLFVLGEYMIHPFTMLLSYFMIEGVARLAGAVVTAEVVPTLPLQLIAWAHGRLEKKQQEKELGPPIEDVVQPGFGEFALVIASCRPKTWTTMTTISYDEKLYELVREEGAPPPRRWVYVLRKRPEGKVVRGEIHQYRPDENMPREVAAVSGGGEATRDG